MKISIIIAVLNNHEVVRRQLLHFHNMNLTPDVEIIIVDDGSEPPLKSVFAPSEVKILYTNDKRNWTQGLARNKGAGEAKGEFLLFTDIDHILTKEAIEAAGLYNGDKMIFPRYFGILDENARLITDKQSMLRFGLDPSRIRRRGLRLFGGVHGNTYSIRKTIFMSIGGYNPEFCEKGFHMGGRYMSEERSFNIRWGRLTRRKQVVDQVMGPKIYHFPVSKFRTDGSNNPEGLFHNLSFDQPEA